MEWERWGGGGGKRGGGGEGREVGGGGKRGGVVEAVLKGEKLFLSINKEIRLKYSNSESPEYFCR